MEAAKFLPKTTTMNRRKLLLGLTAAPIATQIKLPAPEPESAFGLAPLKEEGATVKYDQWLRVEINGVVEYIPVYGSSSL